MKITAGPTIERFAAHVSATIAEVVEWINEYVNNPPDHAEATEAERMGSIKAYILWRLK